MSVARRNAYWLLSIALVLTAPVARAADEPGTLPVGADGKPLNLDFEQGTLDHWTADGEAFQGQPIHGEIELNKPRGGKKAQLQGEYWVGGYERLEDKPQGTLTSVPFTVTQPFARFLIGGGKHDETRVELVRQDTGAVFFKASGSDREEMTPVAVDLRPHLGKEIFIRLVDKHSGGWGHVNFDDFRFFATEPKVPARPSAPGPTDAYKFAGLPADQAAAEMTVPEGFSVQVFAAEPDVQQPIAMALDDRGRLWIAEGYTYPKRAPEGQGTDRILIFEDADGDGHFDKRTVFAEKLNLVSGLEVGFGGVWVGAAPEFLFIPDANHDDQPDGPPQVLLDGWGYQDTHETLNTFIWGPDGWLYGCHGVFTHSKVGKPGTPDDQRVGINAGIWRYHPTRHEFEVFAHGTSNPWGVDFNDRGQAFLTACVIPHLYHVIQGARYERQAGSHFNAYTYEDIKTIADHRHYLGASPHGGNNRSDGAGGGHAHCGAMIYLGGAWPEKYRDQIFMNNIHGQRINEDLLKPQGSGYVGSHGPDFLLSHDRWSQVLNLRYGPDGQAYMIDWYDNQACHSGDPARHDRSNGRIYKISYAGGKRVMGLNLAEKSDVQLAGLMLEANDWYVRHARRLLQERAATRAIDPAAIVALKKTAYQHADETRRLRGLWALEVIGALDEQTILAALSDKSPYVRGWAVQLDGDSANHQPLSATVRQRLLSLAASDPSPVVRLYLASRLQRLPLDQRWDLLAALAAHAEDADDHNLPLMYWYATEPLLTQDLKRAVALAADAKIPLLLALSARRLGALGTPEALETLVELLGHEAAAERQLALLKGVNLGLAGRRQVPQPPAWAKVYEQLRNTSDAGVRSQLQTLAVIFGDQTALADLRGVLVDGKASFAQRSEALAALLSAKDGQLPPVLRELLADGSLRSAALRGLAAFDDGKTPAAILAMYGKLSPTERSDALTTLSARAPFAKALLAAIGAGQIPATDLPADLVRQLRNFSDPEIARQIGEVWGTVRDSAADKKQQMADYKKLVTESGVSPADAAHGRVIFAKTCQQCHTLFGQGAKVGPDLTGSNRANLDYLLSNVVDPSAVMAKEYIPHVITTSDGRVITGIVKAQDPNAVTVQTQNELLVLPRGEIDEMRPSEKSMMPDDLLKPLAAGDVRNLVAYLASPRQVPLPASRENLSAFFNGKDLKGWLGDPGLWSVENGEIVGRTAGLKQNEFLKSEMLLGDFHLTVDVKLVDNRGNSGIQFRSEALPDGEVKGYQADVGIGWWGKLYEERGRALLWSKSGEEFVKPGEWNRYEIKAEGSHIRTWINGQPCVDLDDPPGARRGIVALQLHSGGPTEVRFKNFLLELTPTEGK